MADGSRGLRHDPPVGGVLFTSSDAAGIRSSNGRCSRSRPAVSTLACSPTGNGIASQPSAAPRPYSADAHLRGASASLTPSCPRPRAPHTILKPGPSFPERAGNAFPPAKQSSAGLPQRQTRRWVCQRVRAPAPWNATLHVMEQMGTPAASGPATDRTRPRRSAGR